MSDRLPRCLLEPACSSSETHSPLRTLASPEQSATPFIRPPDKKAYFRSGGGSAPVAPSRARRALAAASSACRSISCRLRGCAGLRSMNAGTGGGSKTGIASTPVWVTLAGLDGAGTADCATCTRAVIVEPGGSSAARADAPASKTAMRVTLTPIAICIFFNMAFPLSSSRFWNKSRTNLAGS